MRPYVLYAKVHAIQDKKIFAHPPISSQTDSCLSSYHFHYSDMNIGLSLCPLKWKKLENNWRRVTLMKTIYCGELSLGWNTLICTKSDSAVRKKGLRKSSDRQRQKLLRSTEYNDVYKSRKTGMVGLGDICLRPKVCRKVRLDSIQTQPGSKPPCSSRTPYSLVLDNRERILAESNVGAMLTKLIPLWFSHKDLSPSL